MSRSTPRPRWLSDRVVIVRRPLRRVLVLLLAIPVVPPPSASAQETMVPDSVTPERVLAGSNLEMFPRGGMEIDREAVSARAAYVWTVSRPETHPFVVEQARFLNLVRSGRIEAAIELFRTALGRSPERPLVQTRGLARLARTLPASEREGALVLVRLGLELDPAHAEAARTLEELGP